MVERVEDMMLPNAVVQRIIKEALPDGINVAKEARAEISKAASIFVLYLTATARQKTQKKTLFPVDIVNALETMEMEHFMEPLKKAMEQHKRQQKNKKDKRQPDQPSVAESTEEADTGEPEAADPELMEDAEQPVEETESLPEAEEMVLDPAQVETEPLAEQESPTHE